MSRFLSHVKGEGGGESNQPHMIGRRVEGRTEGSKKEGYVWSRGRSRGSRGSRGSIAIRSIRLIRYVTDRSNRKCLFL